jgi:acetyl-CoA acetyltransferase
MGNVVPTEPRDAYLNRVAAMDAGIPKETPAFNVNRLCGSALQAIVSAAQSILLGDAELTIGAGAESMSRGAYLLPAARWGARMGNAEVLDYMVSILHDPFLGIHMGVTAFAAQACAVARELEFDPEKVNPNGSGISLGHPVGATGAILVTKALYELHRIRGRYALATMCIGGGQGIAAIFERG